MKPSRILLFGLTSALLFAACAKSSNTSSSSSTAPATASSPAATGAPASTAPVAAAGAKVFSTDCASCHQANGQGVPGAFPPLAGSDIVNGPASRVIHIVKYGLTGPVTVAGKTFNGQMPAWSPQISDSDIAAVITYIRSSWGNHGSAVTTAQVTAVSK
jgi:mono/diheme cytochrome c family protein